MSAAARPRGLASTIAISFFLSAFAGFLWIGRGGFAFAFLLAQVAVVAAILYWGMPVGPSWLDGRWQGMLVRAGIGGLVSVTLVLPFRLHSLPVRWYSRGWGVALSLIGLGALVAFIMRGLLIQTFWTPAGSMAPTLVVGDYFFVSKSAYGWGRYSLPFNLLPVDGRIAPSLPERGDVVVFRHPRDSSTNYVERVVGLPGERIQFIGGVLHIDDKAVKVETIGPAGRDFDGRPIPGHLEQETLPGGATYRIIDRMPGSIGDDTREFEVPAEHLFVVGDDRDNSNDSRFGVGFVPLTHLMGRADRIFWNSGGIAFRDRADLRPQRR